DSGWHVDYYDKYNVTLQSAPGCSFRYTGTNEVIQDRPGDVYRFDNRVPHEVVNESTEDYIVMVVCLKVHDYAKRFKEPEAPVATVPGLPAAAEPRILHHFSS